MNLSKLGRYSEALTALNKALELDPNLQDAKENKDLVLKMYTNSKNKF